MILFRDDVIDFSEKPAIEDVLHYGVKRRSGRYPWGSGEHGYQHSGDFLSRVESLQAKGWTEKQIAEDFGFSTSELRLQKRIATHERRQLQADRARSLREDGKSLNEIAEIMGFANDSSVRALLNQNTADNKNKARVAAELLKEQIDKKGMIDAGAGVALQLGISEEKMAEAVRLLELEGYGAYGIGIPNITNKGKQTNTLVLTRPEIPYADAYKNMGDIQEAFSDGKIYSHDGGETFRKLEYPSSIDSNRVKIRYNEEGGLSKDGTIEIRRGCQDLDLGNSHYAQVRVMVDNSHYLKGMALYGDDKDFPPGVDVIFNTNKTVGTDKMKVLKKIKDDPDNPFGAAIKANGQSYYDDPNGKFVDPKTGKKQSLNAINKLKEEGDWDSMSRNLSSQFLAKQPLSLIKKQLKLTYADAEEEYDSIMALENPTIKRKLLMDFANNCDAATVHLKAAALPRQSTQVILPIDAMKDTEIYAPNYKNGEQVALVRYPHGGTFEIPILTVNNKNGSAKSILGNVKDAVGINSKVAERLSGADFDGDQVVVIPTHNSSGVKIKSSNPLKGLEGFDPKTAYSTDGKTGVKIMTEKDKQKQMGVVSNLITDMTLRGASDQELARAVRHSMVVIDAVKHELDYKQSEKDNGIKELQTKYQKRYDDEGNLKTGGASTLLSRKKQDVQVNERQGSGVIDKETGVRTYKESGRTYVDKKGNTVQAKTSIKLIESVDDVRKLSSGTPQEEAYADYANKMKALANQARKDSVNTGTLKYNSDAKKKYSEEVNSLDSQLKIAQLNAPKERRAQAIANSEVKAKVQDNPSMTKDEIKKASNVALNNARASVGATGKGTRIHVTDKEWEAIQAGAISDAKLTQILRYSDADEIRQRATPRQSTELSVAKQAKIKQMLNSGYTNAEIAANMGISTSTVFKYSE